jgi:selenocysteine lyase/cysteine desulfurase
MIDLAQVRADTPGVGDLTFFGSAGSSLSPAPVTATVDTYLETERHMGGYAAASHHVDLLDAVYVQAARLIGASESEITFNSGASEAWWRAFLAIDLKEGDRVVAGTSEFASNVVAMLQAKARGVHVIIVPNDETGTIDLELLEAELARPQTRLMCLTHVGMANGGVQPADGVGSLAAAAGVPFLLDAAQSIGQMPLDVEDLQCDFLIATGRKFLRAPRGTGLLYVRESILESLTDPVFVDVRSALWTDAWSYSPRPGSRRFEFGEYSHAAKAGFGAALAYAADLDMHAVGARIGNLAARLREGLEHIDGVSVWDRGARLSGIVTFTLDLIDPSTVVKSLEARQIFLNAPAAHNAQFDFQDRGVEQVIRAGVHYFNTEAEIDRLLDAVDDLAG